ncbi:MAG TPA: ATP synthase F1 subunit delta [Geobacteraceae bacterium]
MSANAIAKRYAKALVQLGAEEGKVAKFQEELTGFEGVLAAHGNLRSIFADPAFGVEAKRSILHDVIAKLAVSPTVASFLLLLLEKNRLDFLSQILTCYGALADELSGVVRPTLVTAMAIGEDKVAEIKAALEKMTGRQVVLKVEVDPALIGGVVTKIGDQLFDGSVRTQLQRIEDILQKG